MEAGHARIDQFEPRIAEAVGDPDLAVRGTQSIRGVMVATEVEVASMLARVDADVAGLLTDADTHARMRVADRREQLAGTRRELALHAAALAAGFQNLLGLLDEADARLALPEPPRALPRSAPPAPARTPAPAPAQTPPAAPAEPPRLRLAESPGPAPAPAPQAEAGVADSGVAEGPSRRRWWMRWFRPAA